MTRMENIEFDSKTRGALQGDDAYSEAIDPRPTEGER